jgi:hypothetical protein
MGVVGKALFFKLVKGKLLCVPVKGERINVESDALKPFNIEEDLLFVECRQFQNFPRFG